MRIQAQAQAQRYSGMLMQSAVQPDDELLIRCAEAAKVLQTYCIWLLAAMLTRCCSCLSSACCHQAFGWIALDHRHHVYWMDAYRGKLSSARTP